MYRLSGIAACFTVALLAGCAQREVMIITPYAPDSPRSAEIERTIATRFDREWAPVKLRVFHMNTQSRPTEVWSEEMGRLAAMHVRAFRPTLVFLAGDDAARYTGRELVNRPYPVVFFDVKANPADYLLTPTSNVTGVRATPPVTDMFNLIKALLPQAKRLAVLSDGSLEGDAIAAAVRTTRDPVLSVVMVRRAGCLADWLAAVREAQDRADALILAGYSSVLREPFGQHAVPEDELLKATAQAGRLPKFAFRAPTGEATGLVGVVEVPLSAQTIQAATAAVRMLLYGATMQEILIASCPARSVHVNMPLAKELGIVVPARYRRPSPEPAMPSMNPLERFIGLFEPVRLPAGVPETERTETTPPATPASASPGEPAPPAASQAADEKAQATPAPEK